MNTISEGTRSAKTILRRVDPMRHLYSGAKYVPSHATDIARTFRKARLLARIQARGAA